MYNSKIYITDLDGTLLQNDATLSSYAYSTLTELLNQGVLFTVASARSVITMREILGDLPITLPVIEGNGAYVSDFKTGNHLVINAMEPAMLQRVHALYQGLGFSPLIWAYDGEQDLMYYDGQINPSMQRHINDRILAGDTRLRHVNDITQAFKYQIVNIAFAEPYERLLELEQQLRDEYDNTIEIHYFESLYIPDVHWMTVHSISASKDKAIQAMLQNQGLTDHELVVFGDNTNDVKMFKSADRAVAVENAIDELKACATEIIGTNINDSVVKYILEESGSR